MKPIRLAAAMLVLAGLAHAEPKTFKDWMVGCDNTLTCAALALPNESMEQISYLRIERAAGPQAAPLVTLVAYSEGDAGPATFAVTVDGKPFGGTYKGTFDGTYARATLDEKQSAALIAAIANAKAMTLKHNEASGDPAPVSLSGSSAALRYIDAEQKRDGGVTALVAKGNKPASAVPTAPAAPVVTASVITVGDETPDSPTDTLPKADIDYCGESSAEPIIFNLTDGKILWGVCVSAGAYNYTYDFYVVGKDHKAAPLKAGAEGGDTLSVTNPYLADDGKMLLTFSKGRGIGDCGGEEGFAWDGKTMVKVHDKSLNECRGVSADDWFVTYRATVK